MTYPRHVPKWGHPHQGGCVAAPRVGQATNGKLTHSQLFGLNQTECNRAQSVEQNLHSAVLLHTGCWLSAVDYLLVRCFLFFLGKKSWRPDSCSRPSHQSNLTRPHNGESLFLPFIWKLPENFNVVSSKVQLQQWKWWWDSTSTGCTLADGPPWGYNPHTDSSWPWKPCRPVAFTEIKSWSNEINITLNSIEWIWHPSPLLHHATCHFVFC